MTTTGRCVPAPINSCTVEWADTGQTAPQNRLQAHARTHPNSPVVEREDDDGCGLDLCTRDTQAAVTPPANQPGNIQRDADGCLYTELPKKQSFRVPAVTRAAYTQAGFQNLTGDIAIAFSEQDFNAQGFAGCWYVCVHICNAYFRDVATTLDHTAVVPALTGANLTTTQGGGDPGHTHDVNINHTHDNITIPPRPPARGLLQVQIDGQVCNYLSAENAHGHYSGTVCNIVERLDTSAVNTFIISAGITLTSNTEVTEVSTGDLIVTWEPIGCPDA